MDIFIIVVKIVVQLLIIGVIMAVISTVISLIFASLGIAGGIVGQFVSTEVIITGLIGLLVIVWILSIPGKIKRKKQLREYEKLKIQQREHLVNEKNRLQRELPSYIKSDPLFWKCTNDRVRKTYLVNLLRNSKFSAISDRYIYINKEDIQLTDDGVWLMHEVLSSGLEGFEEDDDEIIIT